MTTRDCGCSSSKLWRIRFRARAHPDLFHDQRICSPSDCARRGATHLASCAGSLRQIACPTQRNRARNTVGYCSKDNMNTRQRPKRALVAYCALAERLSVAGTGAISSLTPFFAEVCEQFSGQMFDAAKFSAAMHEWYGIRIPRLAALGLAEQLADEGLLKLVSGYAHGAVYQFVDGIRANSAEGISPLTEVEIERILGEFVGYCEADGTLGIESSEALHEEFLERLLHVESMRILSRREASIGAKKTAETLVLTKPAEPSNNVDKRTLHLDFLTSQFLLDLRDNKPAAFEIVSNIAFANMAAEALACFREPIDVATTLAGLTVYIDSPLLLDMLGVNTEYADYGKELLETIKASGATPAVLDHCVAEAEAAVYALVNHLRSGINQLSVRWGTSAKPAVLSALVGNVGERAEKRLQIEVHRDPEINLHRRAAAVVGDIEAELNSRMQAWRNAEAKEHDRKSVWTLLALRDTSKPYPRICDARWMLLAKNTALVSIANDSWTRWLKGTTRHSSAHIEKWAPVAMSDKQFAGYVWARAGGGSVAMSRARLLAHCSAAVRPRADVKAKAYNLVLELSGKEEADDIAALLEDREGSRALMRATKGDPEDVTAERLPFILEKVKLAAGEFAAGKVREEGEKAIADLALRHQEALVEVMAAATASMEEQKRVANLMAERLSEEQQARATTELEKHSLRLELETRESKEDARKVRILRSGFDAGRSLYRVLRWSVVLAFGCLTFLVGSVANNNPNLNLLFATLLAAGSFWFVPEALNRPIHAAAMRRLRRTVATADPDVSIPAEAPDFWRGQWGPILRKS